MRRGIGFTLICLGLFLAVLGGAIRYWAHERLVVVPIDLYNTLDLPGRATYLDMTTVKEKTADVVARQTIRADVDASSDRVLVADLSQVISTTDGQFIRASVERAAIDRRTGVAVNCCGEMVEQKPARHDGYLFKLPFDTPQSDLVLWDSTTASANPARFEGTDVIAGHRVQKYVTNVPGQQIRTQPDSGLLVGESRTFDAPVWNTSTKTLWVEPVTGTPLAVELKTRTTLRNSRGQDKVTVFAATLRTDRANLAPETLALVEDSKRRIGLVRQAPPLALGAGATLAALGVGLLLLRRRPTSTAKHAPVSPAVPAGRLALEPARSGRPESARPTAEPPAQRRRPEYGRPEGQERGRRATEQRRSGRHATGEFAVPAALRPGVESPRRPPQEVRPSWDEIGPGRPVSPAPVADRPLSRYIRPYLDGDTGAHRRPDLGHDPVGERTGSHRAPDLDGDTGTHRLPELPREGRRRAAPGPDDEWFTQIRPEGLGRHGRLDPADWSPASTSDRPATPRSDQGAPADRSLTDLLSADRDAADAPPPVVPPRRTQRRRYPDGW
ncbi:DUF3068 domain-containing protein [Cryptosporangium minutisporangium]|uniref:DUF3068 domain-containing protein n=1 Tax=Cryptosporangium minutisporangium TaxID=113569 RepID=A0ABP6SX84_9ACTN